MDTIEIIYQGRAYIIERHAHESDEMLTERGWVIAKQSPSNDIDYIEASKLSIMWQNKKYKKCLYPSQLEDKINEINKSLYV
jgi:hypothetical protein